MKVLHVIPGIAPSYGGPSRAILDMCRALRDKNIEVLISTTNADGKNRLSVKLNQPIEYKGVSAVFFNRDWSEAFKYSFSLARWLKKNVANFDIVHIHAVFSHSSLAAARACRKHNVPYIVRPLGSLDSWSLQQKPFRKVLFWHLVVKKMLIEAKAIHCTTVEERIQIEKGLSLKNSVVVPLGINKEVLDNKTPPEFFYSKYPLLKNSPYILILSRLHSVKGIDLLINVFLNLINTHKKFQQWKLIIAGKGEKNYVDSLKQMVKHKGNTDNIMFVGWIDDNLKYAALKGASLFVLPSHHENFGLSVLEAMACGVPVLVSDRVNLAHDIIQARAGWVVRLNKGDLLDGLKIALSDKMERDMRGKAGRELVRKRFTWDVVAKKLLGLYNSILSTY